MLEPPRPDATSVGSLEDADVAEVDSGLKRKRATGDDGAGPSKRVRLVSLGLSTSTEEENPECGHLRGAKEVILRVLPTRLDEFRQRVEGLLEKQEEKLRKLSIEYDEELYPHMLSAIAERRWLISHGLRLAAMNTLESQEVKQSFGDVVKCALARGKAEAVEELHEKRLLTVPAAQVPGYNVIKNLRSCCCDGGDEMHARGALRASCITFSYRAHPPILWVPVSVATVLPKDSELLGKLEEAGDAAYQVGRSEQSRCHSI
ncbi:hypothetical protein Tco_0909208 [Tanacetum coccineum]|uniref:Uncharacterized protein n=1 Tax=Tanacetum coccineum TaxID=301880 RepID=A0ABQ5CSN4_9ASTR